MPIYEYECAKCHHKFDLIQKLHDEPAKQCPQCFKNTAVRLVSAAGFQLKGSGWYVTDFKNKGTKPPDSQKEVSQKEVGDTKTSADKKSAEVKELKTQANKQGEKD